MTPREGDIVVPKRYYSAFTDTDLDSTCRVHNIGKMVIVGQHTNCCCRHTTYDAFLRGIEVAVVSDATCVFARNGRRCLRPGPKRIRGLSVDLLQLQGLRDRRSPLGPSGVQVGFGWVLKEVGPSPDGWGEGSMFNDAQ